MRRGGPPTRGGGPLALSFASRVFPVDTLPFTLVVSATMKKALILVGKRVGKAV